jgi:hypothetical protein
MPLALFPAETEKQIVEAARTEKYLNGNYKGFPWLSPEI